MLNRQTINTRSRERARESEMESQEGQSKGELSDGSSDGEDERGGQKKSRRDSHPEETRQNGTAKDTAPIEMVQMLTKSMLEVIQAERQPVEPLAQLKDLEEKTCEAWLVNAKRHLEKGGTSSLVNFLPDSFFISMRQRVLRGDAMGGVAARFENLNTEATKRMVKTLTNYEVIRILEPEQEPPTLNQAYKTLKEVQMSHCGSCRAGNMDKLKEGYEKFLHDFEKQVLDLEENGACIPTREVQVKIMLKAMEKGSRKISEELRTWQANGLLTSPDEVITAVSELVEKAREAITVAHEMEDKPVADRSPTTIPFQHKGTAEGKPRGNSSYTPKSGRNTQATPDVRNGRYGYSTNTSTQGG